MTVQEGKAMIEKHDMRDVRRRCGRYVTARCI